MRKFNIAQRRYVGAKTRLLDSINRIFQTHIFKDLESRNCAEIKIKDLESKDYGEGKGKIQIKDLESKDFSLGEIESKHNSAKQSDKINKKNFSENNEITKDSNEGKKCETTRDSNESKTCKDSKNFKLIESGEFRATKNESENCKNFKDFSLLDSKNFKLIESSEFKATKNESKTCKDSNLIESSQAIDSKTKLNMIFQTHIFKDLESRNCAEIKIKDLESKDFSLGEIESKQESAKQSDKINKKNFSENSEITKDSNEGKKCEITRDSNESKTCKDSKLIESNQAIESKTKSNQAKKDSKAESTKTKIDSKKDSNPLSFFDVFAGSGVVSAEMLQNTHIDRIYMNDFLHSNYAIYQGFFTQSPFDSKKLESILCEYNNLDSKNIESNYYEKHFGTSFFSLNDAKKIGYIRDDLDKKLESKMINQKEFYILLTSLLYSSDRVANTVGHYDAFRKNVALKDCFTFKLIKPLKTNKKIEIFKQDSNILARDFAKENKQIDIAFLDPPYNSRQYSRFYHLLETLSLNDKPPLFGIAKKPKPQNISVYCKVGAKEAFNDLVSNLARISKYIVVTYNNTYTSKSSSSQNKMHLEDIKEILQSFGKISVFEIDFKPFSSGKTDLKSHKEYIFISEIKC